MLRFDGQCGPVGTLGRVVGASAGALPPVVAAVVMAAVLVRPGQAGAIQDDERTSLSGQLELARLVDLCAERLGLNIEYDAAALRGTVTLRLGDGVSDAELWTLTNRLLAARGWTSVRMPGEALTVSIVKLADAPGLARIEAGANEIEAGYVTIVTRIEHRPAKQVLDSIRPVLSKTAGATAELGDGGLIMLSDLKARLDEALTIIDELDRPREAPVIEVLPVRFVPAQTLVPMLVEAATHWSKLSPESIKGTVTAAPDGDGVMLIAPPEERAFWRTLLEQLDQRQAIETRTYLPPPPFTISDVASLIDGTARDLGPHGSGDRWRVVANELSGTLVVTAALSEHDQVAALLAQLQETDAQARLQMRSFTIRNRQVGDILLILGRLLEHTPAEAEGVAEEAAGNEPGVSPSNGSRATLPGASSPGTGTGAPARAPGGATLHLTADEETNTLIGIGDARSLEQVERLIAELDVRQPQVMIEVLVLSLSESDSLDLGVELEKLHVSGATLFRLSSLFGLSSVGADSTETAAGDGRGLTGVVLSPADFSIVLRALQTLNDGRSLNVPKVLVNNNEQATLDAVLQEPVTAINASDTVATTSFGGFQSAGTSVTIQPQIAESDQLVLEYSVSLSAFVGESSDPAIPPPRQQNTLQSKVTIPDSYAVVVGGLDVTKEAEATSRVPLLGSLPLLGELFSSRSVSKSRSRFYVFIRASVLRHAGFEDLKYISDREAVAVQLHEEGGDDGGNWPVVHPRIIR